MGINSNNTIKKIYDKTVLLLAKFPDQSGGKVPVVQSSIPDTATGDLAGAHSGIDSIDGKITACNTGAAVLAAGAAFIGRSGVKAFKFSQSFTRLNSATAYSAGDAVNNSDSSPAILTQDLTSYGAALSQFIVITNVQVVLSVKNAAANLDAYIFPQTFAATNDNAELSVDDATAASGGHVVRMSNNNSTALNTKLQADPGQYVIQLAATGTPSLYVALQTPAGYTPTAQAVYTLIMDGYLL